MKVVCQHKILVVGGGGGGESNCEKLIDKELYSIPKRIMKEKQEVKKGVERRGG